MIGFDFHPNHVKSERTVFIFRSIKLEVADLNGSEHFVICRKSLAHIFKGCDYLQQHCVF
jgi:hypothetical protein